MNDSYFHGEAPFWLDHRLPHFPDPHAAMQDPNGLLAIGGDLTPNWILAAYQLGIFPWFSHGDPILWWSPNPRSVLKIAQFKLRRSLQQRWREKVVSGAYQLTLDQSFEEVMEACAHIPRPGQDGTWIHRSMIRAYQNLHQQGHAHSVEVWQYGKLVGGLYGLAIGKMFFGESMFSRQTDASKLALSALCMQLANWGFEWIDTQVETSHLLSLGAELLPRDVFMQGIARLQQNTFTPQKWQFELNWQNALSEFLEWQAAAKPL
ncbi:MAG: leucyl/phenylalanyl-tRNA--protein transferase [Thiotrichales bacterium]|nr:leucyl/phenylalanyl-tRNA--protein transferase [Thiotrichales bacterium]